MLPLREESKHAHAHTQKAASQTETDPLTAANEHSRLCKDSKTL